MILLKKIFLLCKSKLWFYGLVNGIAANIELLKLIESIKKLKTLIDVGSNKGQFMLLLEKLFPNISIISFEPIKEEMHKQKKFNFNKEDKLKVPHMGWNFVVKSSKSKLTSNFSTEFRFYFVHSYYVEVENQNNSILKSNYGIEFDSAIQNKNIYGAQFHPEKSHKFGMKLLFNFSKI